jgi:FdhD protein
MGPLVRTQSLKVGPAGSGAARRVLPEEMPVAFVYDGTTHAVMMASPSDLEDLAYGFSLTEGRIARPADVAELEIVTHPSGIEARMWLVPDAGREIANRRRAVLGPTGCGLCGVDSLEAALPPVRVVDGDIALGRAEVTAALAAVRAAQVLNAEAHALHAAGLWTAAAGLVALREDVGRHNALDKLAGGLARDGRTGGDGMLVLTSRLSVELVQKAAVIGTPVIVAVSAPTALALRTAEAAGITVVAVARDDGFEVFTHPRRIRLDDDGRRAAG